MLFDATFSPCWEGLEGRRVSEAITSDKEVRTLAISPQLLPASRIVFSLCSSAGLHGVFVLLFFGAGATMGDSLGWPGSSRSAGSPDPGADMKEVPAVTEDPGALRFRDAGGFAGSCGARNASCA